MPVIFPLRLFTKTVRRSLFTFSGSQKKSKGYKALNVVAKAQQARARRNETAASHTTDDALSVNGDGHEKPPTRQKQLLSRQRSNKTSIEKQTCAVAEEQEMEEMPGTSLRIYITHSIFIRR